MNFVACPLQPSVLFTHVWSSPTNDSIPCQIFTDKFHYRRDGLFLTCPVVAVISELLSRITCYHLTETCHPGSHDNGSLASLLTIAFHGPLFSGA